MNRLKQLREEKEHTQKQVADILGILPSTLSNWENNYTQMDYDSLIKLSNFYNVSVGYLIGKDEKPNGVTPDEMDLIAKYRGFSKKHKTLAKNIFIEISNIEK